MALSCAQRGSAQQSFSDSRWKTLFVANADANNIAVFSVDDDDPAKPQGFIPTGWYQLGASIQRQRLYFASGR